MRGRGITIFASVVRRSGCGCLLRHQHHAEQGFALHHAGVTIGDLFERNGQVKSGKAETLKSISSYLVGCNL